jgi:hypothetical protein
MPPGGLWADPDLYDIAVWRDSLYVCSRYNSAVEGFIHQVAQWIGGDAVEGCSTVGIDELDADNSVLAVTPLAEPGRWTVKFPRPGSWTLTAYDALGRAVGNWHADGTRLDVDLGSQTHGLYVLRASLPSGEVHSAKVIQP